MTERRRRRVEIALGAIWLIDGALQFQPYMFSKQFFAGVLGMANMGLPGILARLDYNVSSLLAAYPVWWNTVFATLQVAIGLGLLWGRGRLVVLARTASILWGIGVWLVGEGAGALFMGGTSLLTGAPGAAVLYSVLTVSIWPVPAGTTRARAVELSARAGWVLAWAGSALLELQGVNHAGGVPGAQIANGAAGEPWFFATLDRAVGHGLEGSGGLFALVLGLVAVGVGLGPLWRPTRAGALAVGIVIATFVGLVGQNLGGVFTGQGTDPGPAPLLILMAVTLWPAPARAPVKSVPDQSSPAPRGYPPAERTPGALRPEATAVA
jgi:hypothetical protein